MAEGGEEAPDAAQVEVRRDAGEGSRTPSGGLPRAKNRFSKGEGVWLSEGPPEGERGPDELAEHDAIMEELQPRAGGEVAAGVEVPAEKGAAHGGIIHQICKPTVLQI